MMVRSVFSKTNLLKTRSFLTGLRTKSKLMSRYPRFMIFITHTLFFFFSFLDFLSCASTHENNKNRWELVIGIYLLVLIPILEYFSNRVKNYNSYMLGLLNIFLYFSLYFLTCWNFNGWIPSHLFPKFEQNIYLKFKINQI